MDPDSKGKKKPYSPPGLTELTREQAIKMLVKRRNWTAEEAADFLDSLRRPKQQEGKEKDRKRSA